MCKFLSWFTTECFRLCFLNFLSKLNGFTYVGPFKNTKGLDKQGPLTRRPISSKPGASWVVQGFPSPHDLSVIQRELRSCVIVSFSSHRCLLRSTLSRVSGFRRLLSCFHSHLTYHPWCHLLQMGTQVPLSTTWDCETHAHYIYCHICSVTAGLQHHKPSSQYCVTASSAPYKSTRW